MGNEEVIPYDGKTRNLPYVILWWFFGLYGTLTECDKLVVNY